MKKMLFFVLAFLLLSCSKDRAGLDALNAEVLFATDQQRYFIDDTLHLSLINNRETSVVYWTRCGILLEVSYQEKTKSGWSETKDFPLPECVTISKTLSPAEEVSYHIPATFFASPGEYRLLTAVQFSNRDDDFFTLFSNPLEIMPRNQVFSMDLKQIIRN